MSHTVDLFRKEAEREQDKGDYIRRVAPTTIFCASTLTTTSSPFDRLVPAAPR